MAGSKFTLDRRVAFYRAVAAGQSLPDASLDAGIGHGTVKKWLAAGRAGEEPYAEFAQIVDALKAVERSAEPITRAELLAEVSKSARKGSVSAQKLAWEILNDDGSSAETQVDPLAGVDEIAQRRAA